MVLLKATHIDVENLIASASKDKPYLVYSNKKGNPNLRDSNNVLNGRKVYIRWAGNEDKEFVALVVLDEKKTKDIIDMSIEARTKGGLTKFENLFYSNLQPIIKKLNEDIEKNAANVWNPTSTVSNPTSVNTPKAKPKVTSTLESAPVESREVAPDADVKKRFKEKYSYYTDKNNIIVNKTYIDKILYHKFHQYTGYALQLLTDDKVRKSYSKLDLELVILAPKEYAESQHYLVPKGCGYLVSGDVKTTYYEKFKSDEKQLDKDIENLLAIYDKIEPLIRKVEKEQDFEDNKTALLENFKDNKDEFLETFKETKDDLVESIKETKFGKFLRNLSK
jgi:hypothetical protein